MMVAMLASSRRAIVSSRRCCWVLAISDRDAIPVVRYACLQEPSGLHGLPVAVAEPALAEHDRAVDAGATTAPSLRLTMRAGRRRTPPAPRGRRRGDSSRPAGSMTTRSARSPARSVPASSPSQSASSPVSRRTACSSGMNGRPAARRRARGAACAAGSCRRPCCEVRARVGEADVHAGSLASCVELVGTVVGDHRAPAHAALAVLDDRSRKASTGWRPRSSATAPNDLADQRRVGARHDEGVVEVAVPHARRELLAS